MGELVSIFGRVSPPALSVFQICALNGIGTSSIKNAELMGAMRAMGFEKSSPCFSDSMQALQRAGLVEGWYTHRKANGYAVREKHFKITDRGRKALEEARHFFERLSWNIEGPVRVEKSACTPCQ